MKIVQKSKWEPKGGVKCFHKNMGPDVFKYLKTAKSIWKKPKDTDDGCAYTIVPVEMPDAVKAANAQVIDRTNKLYALMIVNVTYPGAQTWQQKNQQGKESSAGGDYSRLIWALDMAGKDGSNLVAIFTYHQDKTNIFDDNVEYRANGVFSPGGIFIVERPPYAEKMWNGNKVLTITDPVKMARLKIDCLAPTFRPMEDPTLPQHAFLMHGVLVYVIQMKWSNTSCYGLLCDALGTVCDKKRCACYDSAEATGQTVLNVDLMLVFPNGVKERKVLTFTSKKFTSLLFISGRVPVNLKSSQVRHSIKAEAAVINKVKAFINYVNENGGWTTLGWSKRGQQADQAEKKDENVRKASTTASSNVTFHLTLLQPTENKLPMLYKYKLHEDVFDTFDDDDDSSVDSAAELEKELAEAQEKEQEKEKAAEAEKEKEAANKDSGHEEGGATA